MTSTHERFEQTTAPSLSIEDAMEMKDELLHKERTEEKDLESMLHQMKHGSKQEYLQTLSGVSRVIAEIKEFLGYGIEHDYQEHLKSLDTMSSKLRGAVGNTEKLISEYMQKEVETRVAYSTSKRLLVLNERIYTAKEQQRAEKQAKLAALESPSVLGSLNTAEALGLEDDMAEIEEDMWKLDIESDRAAVQYKVAESTHHTHKQLRQSLQLVYRDLQKQQGLFDAHCEVARANERIISKLKGVDSVKVLHAEAGVLIQQLEGFQEKLPRSIGPLAHDYDISRPALEREKTPARPYWRSVMAEIMHKR